MSQDIEGTIAQLEAWRDRIDASIETLKYFLAQGQGVPSSPLLGGNRLTTDAEIRHDSFFQMTILDAAEKYLAIVKVTKPTAEIAEGLLSGGLKTAAKNFSETLRSTMGRDERFVRVNGEWGLAAWYPAMKRERKARTGEPETQSTAKQPDSQHAKKSRPKPKKRAGSHQSSGTVDQKLLAFLDSHPSRNFSPSELASHIDANPNSIKAALAALYKKNQIGKPEQGRYQALKGEAA